MNFNKIYIIVGLLLGVILWLFYISNRMISEEMSLPVPKSSPIVVQAEPFHQEAQAIIAKPVENEVHQSVAEQKSPASELDSKIIYELPLDEKILVQ